MNTVRIKVLFSAVVALSLAGVGAADAAAKHKRHPARHYTPVVAAPAAPNTMQTPRPIWASPQECYTDEGYGRYWPCGAGKSE